MVNEFIFLVYSFVVAAAAIGALWLSYEALVALVCVEIILMNLFVTKEILLCGFVATAADVLGIGVALTLNLIQEYYGADRARRTMWLGFAAALMYVLFSFFQCGYLPAPEDRMHAHFLELLTPMPRIICASLVTFLIAQTADRNLYAIFNRIWHGGYFIARNELSLVLTQLLDTVLFSFLGLYGLISNLANIVVVSYLIKLIAILLAVPFLWIARRLFPRPSSYQS
jgi:queuosine precursor transporter